MKSKTISSKHLDPSIPDVSKSFEGEVTSPETNPELSKLLEDEKGRKSSSLSNGSTGPTFDAPYPPNGDWEHQQSEKNMHDRPPAPKRTIEYQFANEKWRHEIQPGERVVAVQGVGVVEGIVVTRDMATVVIRLNPGTGQIKVHVDDVMKIKR